MDGHTLVFRQNGVRSFADPDVYDMADLFGRAVVAADLNEDGVLDTAESDDYGRIGLLLSGAGGSRALTIIETPSDLLRDIVIADFDGDGHLDIATTGPGNDTISFLWGTGAGNFLPRVDRKSCIGPMRLAVIDANEDQRPDLVVGCNGATSWLLTNNGDRSFTVSGFCTRATASTG